MTLKITALNDTPELVTLRIEGRLTVDAVAELQAVCAAPLRNATPVVLQLSDVSFVDAAGVDELRDLERRGCVLVGCSDFVATLLAPDSGRPSATAVSAQDPGEAAQLRALRAGDVAAFEQLVRRQSGPLLNVARRILGNDEDARDAVQEGFVSAYRNLDGFAGESRVSTWLHRIVVNAALMKLRTRRRRPEESIDALLPCFDETGAWASGAPSSDGAEAKLEARERRELVRRCIARLPETYREVLVLRDIEDLDTAEVAVGLGITANAVKIRLHRARQALRTLVEQDPRAGAPADHRIASQTVAGPRDRQSAPAA